MEEDLSALKFEDALAELETLVGKMENGKLPLESLTAYYERGNRLLKSCRAKLDALERKIEILEKDDGASGDWSDFNASVPEQSRNAPSPPPQEDSLPF